MKTGEALLVYSIPGAGMNYPFRGMGRCDGGIIPGMCWPGVALINMTDGADCVAECVIGGGGWVGEGCMLDVACVHVLYILIIYESMRGLVLAHFLSTPN